MGSIRVLVESELRQAVGLDVESLAVIESVYPLVSTGAAVMPPIMRIDVPAHNGEIDIKSAYLPGHPAIAIKVSAGFFDNPALGLPSLGGLMVVLDAETGIPRAALFDNGYLTDVRTALAGAVAARHLARADASIVAIVGAGVQARLQLEALSLVRELTEVRVWARNPERADAFARQAGDACGIPVRSAESVADAVAGTDIVVTTTPATTPLVTADMVGPGSHITAVGSDAEHKRELATDLVVAAHLFVCDSIPQSRRLGELRGVTDEGARVEAVELGSIIDGSHPGRDRDDAVTVCDLTGTGAQDTAIAGLAMRRMAASGLGTTIAT